VAETRFGFLICIIFCNIVCGLDLNLKNLNHFTGKFKRLQLTAWGQLPWSRYANTTLNHDKVSISCALLAPQWKQSLWSTSVQSGDTWSLECSIERPDRQNRKLRRSWSSLKQNTRLFACKRSGFVQQVCPVFWWLGLESRWEKWWPDSIRVAFFKEWLDSRDSQSLETRVRVIFTKSLSS